MMNGTGIDYSKYPFEIFELRQFDWDGLLFTIDFKQGLSDEDKANFEKLVNDWYKGTEALEEYAPHFLSSFSWVSDCNLGFWVDFGMSGENVLEDLLDEISKIGGKIKHLYLGRAPALNLSKEQLLKPLEELGIDPAKIPFKVITKRGMLNPPITINFKRRLTDLEKGEINEIIYDYFTKDKEEKEEAKYFLGVKWNEDQVGWWTPREFLLIPATLYPFFDLFTPYKDLIKELIIGVFLKYDSIKKFI